MNDAIEQLISTVELSDISSIRAVLNRIIEVATAPHSSAFDLKDAIETDPPLAARILKRANSAMYGVARKGAGISDIHTAIVCVGFETVKELALSQSVCQLFRSEDAIHGYSRLALWEHCVATATAGRLIFRREFQMPGGQVHAAGLLHDVGIIVEDQCAQSTFRQALKALGESPELSLCHHERQIFGFSHADVGRALAERWDFPASLCLAIGAEELPSGECDVEPNLIAATVRLASWAVQRRRLGFVEEPHLSERVLLDALKRLNVSRRGLDLILDEVELEMERMRHEAWF